MTAIADNRMDSVLTAEERKSRCSLVKGFSFFGLGSFGFVEAFRLWLGGVVLLEVVE